MKTFRLIPKTSFSAEPFELRKLFFLGPFLGPTEGRRVNDRRIGTFLISVCPAYLPLNLTRLHSHIKGLVSYSVKP